MTPNPGNNKGETVNKIVNIVLKILLRLFLFACGAFAVTFVIYILNLDMKLTAKMEPVLFWFYDRVKRDQHL